MSSCEENSNAKELKQTESTGTQQVKPPVLNSGVETETRRAEEAVGKDTTNRQTHVGKDEKGAVRIDTDSTD